MANIHKLLQLTFLFAAMTGKSRLGPDPSISINDLQRKINEVMQRQGCRDLNKLLHSRHAVSWKTSPDPEWLGTDELVDICSTLFSLHTNGVLQSTKMRKALLALQAESGRINFTKLHDTDFADGMDEKIRIACQQYRELKRDPKKYLRCIKKASVKEKNNIDNVLSFLQLHEDDTMQIGKDQGQEEFGEIETDQKQEEPRKDEDSTLPSPSKVFKRVLSREASDPASPSFAAKSTKQVSGSASFLDRQGSGSSLEGKGNTDSLDKKNSGSPLECKSNTDSLGRKSSGSSMGRKGSSKIDLLDELDLSADEKKELAVWMHQNSKMEKKQKRKKGNKSGMKKPASSVAPKKTATAKSVKSQVSRKKQATYKTSFMQRATSSAYHREKLKALKKGKSEEAALDAARMASAKVRDAINNGLMKEE